MKKNLLFTLSILLFSISFASCSSDDDNNDTGSNSFIELYINDVKQKVSENNNLIAPIVYDDGLLFYIYYNGDSGDGFWLNFDGISLDNLKVGDDLVKKSTEYDYQLEFENDHYWLLKSYTEASQFKDYQGQALVSEFDRANKIIKVEFTNIKLPLLKGITPSNDKVAKVKCTIKYKID